MVLNNLKEVVKDKITVGFLFESNEQRLGLKPLNGNNGFDRSIVQRDIHRPGLALAGYVELFTYDRVQVFGNTEMRYLQHLSMEDRIKAFEKLIQFDLPCIIVTDSNVMEPELLRLATEKNISVFGTSHTTTKFVYLISDFLDDQFAPQTQIHASFLDVYGIGLLFIGKSGIGKSELALDLVERGHRLVADDVVIVTRKGEGILMGAGSALVQHFLEVRGLGLIDVRAIFGIRAIRFQKRVEVVVELVNWDKNTEYTRTGLDQKKISVLGVEIPHVKLPINPGKNLTVIAEIVALDYLLKHYGYDAPKEFAKRLESAINDKSKYKRAIDYFEHDFE